MAFNERHIRIISVNLGLMVITFCVGLFVGNQKNISQIITLANNSLHYDNPIYPHISPLLECNPLLTVSDAEVRGMKDKLESLIKNEEDWGNVTDASIYFRDLNNGPWVGIGENEKFIPGSLLKVPFMMAIYKMAETNPAFLAERIVFHRDTVNDPYTEYFKPDETLVDGQAYTVDELVRRMIIYSDNEAALALVKNTSNDMADQVYRDFGLPVPSDPGYAMTVMTYGSFLRVLYNATYLNQAYSEKALDLLDQSTFKLGLVAGVPTNIKVSNKFGERILPDSGKKQFHDCGIVYYPGKPYLLCVMTQGNDFETLANVIGDVSKTVFAAIDQK